ncbi:MAG: M48 family metalloprotease [Niastella sp.]|nr:M48 family metalloprotease [Niastella sp.]
MQLLFVKGWLPDNVVRAICWTLIHSLWQGLILAALAGLLVIFTRKSVAAFRYNMLAVLFFIFMGVVTFTLIYELNGSNAGSNIVTFTPAAQTEQIVAQLPVVGNAGTVASTEEGYLTRFTGYFNQHASLFVAIWFLVFLAKAVKLMGGLVCVQRIKHYKTHTPGQYWTNRMQELSDALGVKISVRLLESELVKVPLVAGFLKPIILVPLGLMANMPAEQVEAILLHELAHIRRRDFLVNLAQSFAETLFFFNPAVLWLSALLREEREHCCDDMAIAVTQSKTGYINALVSFQEYQLENNVPYTMAFPGKKNQLLNRVKRIIDNSHKTLNMAEKSFLVLCLSLIGILSAVWAQPEEKKKPQTTKQEPAQQQAEKAKDLATSQQDGSVIIKDESSDDGIDRSGDETIDESNATDTTYTGTDTTYKDYTSNYKPYAANYQPYEPRSLREPATPASKDTMPVLHKGNSVMTGTITHDKDGKKYQITIDKNLATGLTIDGEKVPDEKLIEYRELISSIFRDMQARAEEAYETRVHQNNDNAIRLANKNKLLNDEAIKLQQSLLMKGTPQVRQGFPVPHSTFKLHEPIQTENKIIDRLIDDLEKAGLITQRDSLTFKLNKDEFTVNGKAISGDIRRQFQETYITNPANTFTYARQGVTTSSHVYVD